jgi:hypothetical protein
MFDEVFAPIVNQSHVSITTDNKKWFLDLIHDHGPQVIDYGIEFVDKSVSLDPVLVKRSTTVTFTFKVDKRANSRVVISTQPDVIEATVKGPLDCWPGVYKRPLAKRGEPTCTWFSCEPISFEIQCPSVTSSDLTFEVGMKFTEPGSKHVAVTVQNKRTVCQTVTM